MQDSSQIKRNKTEKNDILFVDPSIGAVQPSKRDAHAIDESWWKNYFEQKLELQRQQMQKEDERHTDHMNFQKIAIMLQKRIEKNKIEAMNNLTNALLRLHEKSDKP